LSYGCQWAYSYAPDRHPIRKASWPQCL